MIMCGKVKGVVCTVMFCNCTATERTLDLCSYSCHIVACYLCVLKSNIIRGIDNTVIFMTLSQLKITQGNAK